MSIEIGAGSAGYPTHLADHRTAPQAAPVATKSPQEKAAARKAAAQKKRLVEGGYDANHLLTTPDGNVILDLDAVDHASFMAAVKDDANKSDTEPHK